MASDGHLIYDFRTMQLCRDLYNLFSNQPYINKQQLLIITQPYHQVLSHLQVWLTISIAFCMMTVNATVNSSNLGLHTYFQLLLKSSSGQIIYNKYSFFLGLILCQKQAWSKTGVLAFPTFN